MLFAYYCSAIFAWASSSGLSRGTQQNCDVAYFSLGHNSPGKCYTLPPAIKWISSSFSQSHYLNKPDPQIQCVNETLCYRHLSTSFYAPRDRHMRVHRGCNYGQCRTRFMGRNVFTPSIPLAQINQLTFPTLSSKPTNPCKINTILLNADNQLRRGIWYIPIYLQATYQLLPTRINHTFYFPITLKDGSCDALHAKKHPRKRYQ
ncbi:hypothetical protein DSO57_1004344 [Entomophthora muscae]|uniref:Uncharacterized protein n=1 Tax=Entomophthora muscae TaxID=34485 RepID=A0ACC2T886_9FUNG|nr:hypothetical protein DSO57_1004344 [Entomophthora muscae]